MPELKNYRLLISHSWKYSTQYETLSGQTTQFQQITHLIQRQKLL